MCTYWKKLKRSSTKKNKKIDSIGIGLASPEEIRRWGERKLPNGTVVGKVEKDHTVDYESLKPIEGGLFCERIFGPVEDFYCSCERRGEKGEQFCPECQVEFTKSRVRRTRMGYIPLAVPVAHVWYLRGRPSYIANLIGKSRSTVDKVAYGETLCESFIGNTLQSTTLTTAENDFFHPDNSALLSLPGSSARKLTRRVVSCAPTFVNSPEDKVDTATHPSINSLTTQSVSTDVRSQSLRTKQAMTGPLSFLSAPLTPSTLASLTPSALSLLSAKLIAQELTQHATQTLPVKPESGSAPVHSIAESNNYATNANSSFAPITKSRERSSLVKPEEKALSDEVTSSKTNSLFVSQAILQNKKVAQPVPINSKENVKREDLLTELTPWNSVTKSMDKINLTSPVHFKNSGLHLLGYSCTSANYHPHFSAQPISNTYLTPEKDAAEQTRQRTGFALSGNVASHTLTPSMTSPVQSALPPGSLPAKTQDVNSGFTGGAQHQDKSALRVTLQACEAADTYNNTRSSSDYPEGVNKSTVEDSLLTRPTDYPLQKKRKKVHLDFLGIAERRYHQLHTLPVFSTFTYKEWSDRFAFLDYLIWPAKRYDLPVPFYTRIGTPHIARRCSVNLVKNQFGLEKMPKHLHFGLENFSDFWLSTNNSAISFADNKDTGSFFKTQGNSFEKDNSQDHRIDIESSAFFLPSSIENRSLTSDVFDNSDNSVQISLATSMSSPPQLQSTLSTPLTNPVHVQSADLFGSVAPHPLTSIAQTNQPSELSSGSLIAKSLLATRMKPAEQAMSFTPLTRIERLLGFLHRSNVKTYCQDTDSIDSVNKFHSNKLFGVGLKTIDKKIQSLMTVNVNYCENTSTLSMTKSKTESVPSARWAAQPTLQISSFKRVFTTKSGVIDAISDPESETDYKRIGKTAERINRINGLVIDGVNGVNRKIVTPLTASVPMLSTYLSTPLTELIQSKHEGGSASMGSIDYSANANEYAIDINPPSFAIDINCGAIDAIDAISAADCKVADCKEADSKDKAAGSVLEQARSIATPSSPKSLSDLTESMELTEKLSLAALVSHVQPAKPEEWNLLTESMESMDWSLEKKTPQLIAKTPIQKYKPKIAVTGVSSFAEKANIKIGMSTYKRSIPINQGSATLMYDRSLKKWLAKHPFRNTDSIDASINPMTSLTESMSSAPQLVSGLQPRLLPQDVQQRCKSLGAEQSMTCPQYFGLGGKYPIAFINHPIDYHRDRRSQIDFINNTSNSVPQYPFVEFISCDGTDFLDSIDSFTNQINTVSSSAVGSAINFVKTVNSRKNGKKFASPIPFLSTPMQLMSGRFVTRRVVSASHPLTSISLAGHAKPVKPVQLTQPEDSLFVPTNNEKKISNLALPDIALDKVISDQNEYEKRNATIFLLSQQNRKSFHLLSQLKQESYPVELINKYKLTSHITFSTEGTHNDAWELKSYSNFIVERLISKKKESFYIGGDIDDASCTLRVTPGDAYANGCAPTVQEKGADSKDKAGAHNEPLTERVKPPGVVSYAPSAQLGATHPLTEQLTDTQQFPRLAELLHFTGGTALRHLLARFHFVLLGRFLRHELKTLELKINHLLALKMLTYSQGLLLGKLAKRRSKQIRRLKLIELFQSQKSNPEWMILSVLPVLPPDLRPILRVNDDFVVASDLNRLYQTVVRRNNTIQERLDDPLPCPESGLFRQRSLQKAVDGLLENGKGGGTPLCAAKRRPLVSLSHILKGKKGLFRQHLLGKRVDYSGRSVIVVGPKLNLHECGLPKEMAMELFQPFLIHRLKIQGLATSNTAARQMIQQEDPAIWHTVKQLVYEHPVLLNRAPTLHRLGIQAFQPRLVSGRAILLHPLVCNGFNADFDGDQMAVHVPLSFQARAEAWKIMWSKNNLLSPATGQPILVPSQDMVLGCYYLSVIIPPVKRDFTSSTIFYSPSPQGKVSKRTRKFSQSYKKSGGEKKLTPHASSISFADSTIRDNDVKHFFDASKEIRDPEGEADVLLRNQSVISDHDQVSTQLIGRNKKTKKTPKLALVSSAPLATPLTTIEREFSDLLKNQVVSDSLERIIRKRKGDITNTRMTFAPLSSLSKEASASLAERAQPVQLVKLASGSKTATVPIQEICKTTKTQLLNNPVLLHNMAVWQGGKIENPLSMPVAPAKVQEWNLYGLQPEGLLPSPSTELSLVMSTPPQSAKLIAKTKNASSDSVNGCAIDVWVTTEVATTSVDKEADSKDKAGAQKLIQAEDKSNDFVNDKSLMESIEIPTQRAEPSEELLMNQSVIFDQDQVSTQLIDKSIDAVNKSIESPETRDILDTVNRKEILQLIGFQFKKSHYFSSLQDSLMAYFQGKLQTHTPFWVRLGTNESSTETIIESNDNLETPLELRLGADGNLIKVLPTFQNHYSGNATMLDQCQEKSIKYIRTTAGRIVINNALFPSV